MVRYLIISIDEVIRWDKLIDHLDKIYPWLNNQKINLKIPWENLNAFAWGILWNCNSLTCVCTSLSITDQRKAILRSRLLSFRLLFNFIQYVCVCARACTSARSLCERCGLEKRESRTKCDCNDNWVCNVTCGRNCLHTRTRARVHTHMFVG